MHRTTRDQPVLPRPLSIILGVFFALALLYIWATPPFEASDELWHFGMVNAIAETGQLPVQAPGVETAWAQEGSQPPLYYALAAVLVSPVDRTDFNTLQLNPHAKAGIPGDSDNKNLVLHDTPHPAPEGTALAVYILRVLGILLGGLTVGAVYAVGQRLGGRPVAILAAGLTAFNPMFLFISASVNNDTLIMALNSVIVVLMLDLYHDGFSLPRSIALSLLVALAALTKLSGLVLVPVIALTALVVAYRRRDWRGLAILGVLMLATWAILAGWWYARNLALYGELFGTATMAAVAGVRVEPFTLSTLVQEFEGFRVAYWGWFGAVNITTVSVFYIAMDLLVIVALLGLLGHILRLVWQGTASARDTLVELGLLALVLLIGSGALVAWTAQTYASQGRLLFPFLAVISPLLAQGLVVAWRVIGSYLRAERAFATLLTTLLAFVAAVIPITTIAPQYAPPLPLAALPETAEPVYARFGDVALVGYETPDVRYEPGDQIPITVYWQVLATSARDLSLYLHAVDDTGAVIGRIDSYPGGGRLRTTGWQPGALYPDHYTIPLSPDVTGAYRLRVQVGWWDYETREVVQPLDEAGTPLESVMLDVGGFAGPTTPPDDLTPVAPPVTFGGVIQLVGYRLEEAELILAWEALGTPADSYTVFVQWLDNEGVVATQGDAPPRLPTQYWNSGERYMTTHPVDRAELQPGETYRLLVGWYNPADLMRLDAEPADDAYVVLTLTAD